MKYLIVGLGNIGSEYEHTRHNIGFDTLDAFAEASNVFFENANLTRNEIFASFVAVLACVQLTCVH